MPVLVSVVISDLQVYLALTTSKQTTLVSVPCSHNAT